WENRTSPYNIFLRKSNDLGLSWGPEIRVSDSGTSLTLNPRIAVSGDYVYVVWTDTRSGTREAYLRASYDGGMSWQPEKAMSTEADNLKANNPQVVAVEDMVFVAWDEEVEWDTGLGGKVPELYFANSTDRGENFSVQRITECEYKPPDWDPDSSTSPKIVVNYPNMHITYDKWYSPDRGSIAAKSEAFYMMSPDGGGSWTAPTNLSTAGNVRVAYSSSIAVEGDNVYALWRDSKDGGYFEAYLRISQDGGYVWGQEMRLSPLEDNYSGANSIAVRDQEVFVTIADARDSLGDDNEIYFLKSSDAGETWGEYTRLTYAPHNSGASRIALSYTHTHIVWQDNRNGGASTDYDVYYMRSPGWM
ncbi:MAG: sialidase family protein, partial [Candidatus Thermoplasmatota archaeon]|nr:sialidase family protein [Candidatus Thermoplasmatota archaeon]